MDPGASDLKGFDWGKNWENGEKKRQTVLKSASYEK
jgi:hypothetical protein